MEEQPLTLVEVLFDLMIGIEAGELELYQWAGRKTGGF